MINLNPALIILLVVPLSWVVNRYMRRLTSIFIGMGIAGAGVLLAGSSMSWATCLLGIACFSVGEMLSSPKMSEYLGVIAPPDKKALYMGYSNIPFAIGWGYGTFAGGNLYGQYAEKATLALRYLTDQLHVPEGTVDRTSAFAELLRRTGWSAAEATERLWDAYDPSVVWLPFAGGIAFACVALLFYNAYARRHWQDVSV